MSVDRPAPGHDDESIRPIAAAIAVLIHMDRVLLVRRAHPPDPGLWGFPGGRIEAGETTEACAIRELREETGVDGEAIRVLTVVDAFDRDVEQRLRHHFVLVAVLCRWVDGEPFPGDDALEARWISVDRLEDAGLELSRDVAKVARQAISSRESTGSPQISVMNTAVLDHVSITVPDLAVAEVFYDAALAALGIAKVGSDHADAWIGYGPRCDARHPDRTYFSIRLGPEPEASPRRHCCFKASDRSAVEAFWKAGLRNGGTDNGAPGLRAAYHPSYYAAFLIDPAGNRVEAVCHHED